MSVNPIPDEFSKQAHLNNHALMHYIVEHNKSAIAVHDREMRYLYVSQSYIDDYKVKAKDILGKNHYDVFPDLPQKWKDVHQRALKGEVLSSDCDRYEKSDGSVDWTSWECRPWYESDGSIGGIIIYSDVITNQVVAENELIKARNIAEQNQVMLLEQKEEIELNHERLESLFKILEYPTDSIHELLDFALDQAVKLTRSKIGYIYFYDESTQQFELNSWSKDVLKECRILQPQTTYDLSKTGLWGEAVRQRKPILINDYMSENSIKKGTPDGHAPLGKFLTIPLFSDNMIVAVAGVANKERDYNDSDIRQLSLLMDSVWKIRERVQLLTDLRASKELAEENSRQLRDSQNVARIGYYIFDINSGKWSCSEMMSEIFGIDNEYQKDVEGWLNLIHPEFQPEMIKYLNVNILKEHQNFDKEYKIVNRKTSSIHWVHGLGSLEFDRNGNLLKVFGTIQDITPDKIAEQDLIKAKEKAEESENKFKTIFYKNSLVCLLLDRKSGKIVDANDAALSYYGYTYDKIKGLDISMISITDSDDTQTGFPNDLVADKSFKCRHKISSGEIRHMEIYSTPLTFNNAEYLYSICHDVSDRIKSEALNQMLKHSLDVFSDAIYWMDIDNRFIYVNEAGGKAFGCKPEELLGKTLYDVNPTTTPETLDDLWCKLRTTGSYVAETVHRRLDGSEYFVEVRSVYVQYDGKEYNNGYARDITERKNAEKEIRKLQKAIESSKASIVITDSEGNIEYANQYFSEMTGYSPEEYLGVNPRFLKTNHHHIDYYKKLWQTINSGCTWEGEFLNRKKNGDLYWENAIISPIMNESGSISHYVAIKTDISENKKISSELIKSKEKAEESNRLKTAFLQNMSHEVRTPLNAITGFSQLIMEKKHSAEKLEVFSNMISISSDKLIGIIGDVIEISKIQSEQLEINPVEIELEPFISRIMASFDEKARRKYIDLQLDQNTEKTIIFSDINKLEKIFFHLIDNALKFTGIGSVKVSFGINQGKLHFTVSDTGIGIAADQQKIIFEPFRQVETESHRNYGGNGLGLAIVKAYTELFKGTISLKSGKDEGTIISVSLPVDIIGISTNSSAGEKTLANLSVDALPSMTTILIAEDESINFLFLREVLRSKNTKILHANNGQHAVDICRENSEISLVLMDLKMPVMDGSTATRLIKQIRPDITVIAQTAYALDSEKLQYSGLFDDYLTKPIKRDILKQKLAKYMKFKSPDQ